MGTSYAVRLTATATRPHVHVTAGALPTGLTLNATTGVLSGTPTAVGRSPARSPPATPPAAPRRRFDIVVDQKSAFSNGPPGTGTNGTAYTFQYTAAGTPAPSFSLGSAALPSGLTLSSAGLITGTPTVGGTFTESVVAGNGVGANVTQNFTLTIDQAPAITNAATSTTFTVAAHAVFTVTDTGVPAPTLSESGVLPSGVVFNAAKGLLSGTPAAGTGKAYSLTFTANNNIGTPATLSFVLDVDQPAAITSKASTTFTVGTAGAFTVTDAAFPTPTLTESGTLPSGVSFTDNGNGTGFLSGTPAANMGGIYHLSFTGANGVGANSVQSYTLTVDQAPAVAGGTSTTFTVGTAGIFLVTGTGFPAATLSGESARCPPASPSIRPRGTSPAPRRRTPATPTP